MSTIWGYPWSATALVSPEKFIIFVKTEEMNKMYALTRQNGGTFEIIAVSEQKTTLSGKMKEEVLTFIEEVYSDEEELDWLMPISDDMTFWCDEDDVTPVVYRIVEVPVM